MPTTLGEILQFSLISLTSIFFLVDPFAAIPAFFAMTAGDDQRHRERVAARAAWTCCIVLAAFAAVGSLIFKLFGITLPAFKIAGGIILILIGLEMLQARRSQTKETPLETEEGAEKDDAGIIPLGVPMLAGPGSISTVMVLMGQSERWWQVAPIFASIAITSLASYWVLSAADRIRGYLGETGIRILMRMMGLLLVAIAVQFIINGLGDLGVVRKT